MLTTQTMTWIDYPLPQVQHLSTHKFVDQEKDTTH